MLEPTDEALPAFLAWCGGLDASLRQNKRAVFLQATLLMRRQPEEPKFDFSPLKFFNKTRKAGNPK